jgi:hypothetical protein
MNWFLCLWPWAGDNWQGLSAVYLILLSHSQPNWGCSLWGEGSFAKCRLGGFWTRGLPSHLTQTSKPDRSVSLHWSGILHVGWGPGCRALDNAWSPECEWSWERKGTTTPSWKEMGTRNLTYLLLCSLFCLDASELRGAGDVQGGRCPSNLELWIWTPCPHQ